LKECKECFKSKPLSEYRPNKLSRGGYAAKCRKCEYERTKYIKEIKRIYGEDFTNYDLIPEGHSKCTICEKVKKLESFHKNKQRPNGYCSRCIECHKEYMREWRRTNHEKTLQYSREWKENNKERVLELEKKYRRRNKESIRVSKQNRIARKLNLPNTLTNKDVKDIKESFKDECAISGDDFESLDHFIPLSTGHGGTFKRNIIPLSIAMNSSKRNRNPFEWAETYLTEEQRSNFYKVVEYLAELNGLTVDEYREFVFWCFENKRDADEITDENRDSLELWLRIKDAA